MRAQNMTKTPTEIVLNTQKKAHTITHAQNYRTNDTHEQHTRQNKNTITKNDKKR